MASIRKRGNRYHAQIRKTGHPTLTKSFNDKATALSWAKKVESEVERNLFLDISQAQKTTLTEVLQRYEQIILPKKKAGNSELPRIRLLTNKLGQHLIADLKPHVIATYRDKRLKVVQPSTVRRELGPLSRVLSHAHMEWGITLPHGNPVREIGGRLGSGRLGEDQSRNYITEIEVRVLEN